MEGCYQLLKDSRRQGRRRRTALRSKLIDIQQTVAFCPHRTAGMLPLGLTRRHTNLLCCYVNSCKTPVATVCSFASACVFICAHVSVTHIFSLFALNQLLIQSGTLSVLSFPNPLAREQLCFPHPAVMSTVSQLVGKAFSKAASQFFPKTPLGLRSFTS